MPSPPPATVSATFSPRARAVGSQQAGDDQLSPLYLLALLFAEIFYRTSEVTAWWVRTSHPLGTPQRLFCELERACE
jgi:hypothetical protein